ncbi:MAG: energy transducer TonB [Rhodoplanes sp.]|uniref:energy transducer TonB n=1 Tax=Rhodoplanes sp. TaxID=1968906 RepID=UPI0017BAAF92|nr:energy transducer TonB [Rhodoplanes sp.]NVO15374.1 energy transducer TonB [Rhodoplanes sp.]
MMQVSWSRIDTQRGLLTVVPARAAADEVSTAPPVELRRVVEPQDAGEAGGRDDSNVVSLAYVRAERDHAAGAHAASGHAAVPAPSPEDRPAPARHHGPWRSVLVTAGSVMLHAAILTAFAREPAPVASIGLEVVSVEMVLGADAPAGLAATPSESEAAATAQPKTEPAKAEPEKTEEPKPVEEAKALESETTPQPPKDEPPKEEPRPEIVDEAPERVAAIPPEPPKPQPKLEIKPETKPAAKPKPKAKAEPKTRTATRTAERTSDDARPTNTSAARSTSASGIGVGRSDLSTNYRGIVAAHLARHKQFPAEARAGGHQGSTSVSFTIDGSGRVTSVRLGRGSGIASLDQETTAMVRRASPFPAPPTGQSMSFSVPVSFFLR